MDRVGQFDPKRALDRAGPHGGRGDGVCWQCCLFKLEGSRRKKSACPAKAARRGECEGRECDRRVRSGPRYGDDGTSSTTPTFRGNARRANICVLGNFWIAANLDYVLIAARLPLDIPCDLFAATYGVQGLASRLLRSLAYELDCHPL